TFHNGPFEFDRPWIVHERIHRLDVACAAEIRAGLAARYADEWARDTAQFAERLGAAHVNLHDGIEIIAEWAREGRRLMRAMGATHLLPAPEGAFPTPTNPEPTAAAAQPADPEVTGKGVNPGRQPALDSPGDLSAVLGRLAVAFEQHAALGASSTQPAPEALSKEDAARFIGV